jgi:glycosyltransferase involved in cell wall biosynthesis
MPPRVSILIPSHNAGRWLAATLDSALAQTWPNREIIVVDDGSTDDSLSVARGYEPRGIRVIAQPNRGASAARNQALAAARGDYIQFLDADDLLHPRKIELQMAILESCDGQFICSGEWARFHEAPGSVVFDPQPNYRDLTGVEFLQIFFEQIAMMQPAAWLAPRPLLDRAGPWNEQLSLNDDGEYFARAMLAARGIRFCPGARVYYRSGIGGSLSQRKDPKALQSAFLAMELTLGHLLAVDQSARTKSAAAFGWKWLAFESYPGAPALAREAERRSRQLGKCARPVPAGRLFQIASKLVGWRLAKRLRDRLLARRASRAGAGRPQQP